jgi:hypothetical protein
MSKPQSHRWTWAIAALLVVAIAPAWGQQPRPTRIAYQGQFIVGVRNIGIISGGGANLQVLPLIPGTSSQDKITPSLSSDGQRVAFAAKVGDNFQIWTWDLGADNRPLGAARQLTSGDVYREQPVFSPDGKRIAFVASAGDIHTLNVMNADGTGDKPVANLGKTFSDATPSWSADGARLLFTRDGALWTVSAAGADEKKLRDDARFGAWSPDGRRVAYITGQRPQGLAVMNADGTGAREVVKQLEGAGQPAWSPDGSRLLFRATRIAGGEVWDHHWSVKADGTDIRRFRSIGRAHSYVAWAPGPPPTVVAAGRPGVPALPGATAAGSREPVVIVTPAPDSVVRGVTRIKAATNTDQAYVLIRVDGEFVAAAASPYEIQWNTSNAREGQHTIQVEAFRDDDVLGVVTRKVTVENTVSDPLPAEGIRLELRFAQDEQTDRSIRADLSTSAPPEPLAGDISSLGGSLVAQILEAVDEVATDQTWATVRQKVRTGHTQRASGDQTDLDRTSARVTMRPNWQMTPLRRGKTTPEVPLAQISIVLPGDPVRVGSRWTSPTRVITDLRTLRANVVSGNHEIRRLIWKEGYRTAQIESQFTLQSRKVRLAAVAAPAAAPASGEDLGLPPGGSEEGMPGFVPGMAGVALPPPVVEGPEITINATGTRTTWFAYEAHKVIEIQDRITGTAEVPVLQAAAAGGLYAPGARAGARPRTVTVRFTLTLSSTLLPPEE